MDWLSEGLNNLNYWLVLLAGLVSMILGYGWYHDKLFGTVWRKLSNQTKRPQKSFTKGSLLTQLLILSLVIQSLLYAIIIASGTADVAGAVSLAIILGFVFSSMTIITVNILQKKSFVLSAIDGGFQIVALTAGALIFALWG